MAITLVQSKVANNLGTTSLSFASSTTPGNCVIAVTDNNATAVTLGGSAGNFTKLAGTSTGGSIAIWADPNCAGSQTAVAVNTGSIYDIYEVSGLAASSVLDKSSTGNGSGASWSSGATATTTQPAEFWVGAVFATDGGSGTVHLTGPSSPWANLAQVPVGSPGGAVLSGWQVASSTGAATYSGTDTLGGGATGGYASVVVTLKPFATSAGAATLGGAGSLSAPSVQRSVGTTLAAAGSLTGTAFTFTPPPVFPGKPPNPLGAKIELLLGSTWTDITQYCMLRDLVTISNMGRADEAGSITASQLTLTLKNDGRFTPKNSSGAYFPNIVRNCQIRVSVSAQSKTGVTYSGFRFSGEISSWPPGYDISQRDIYVTLTASGIWRRISANQVNIGSAYSRYVTQLTGTSVPATAWSMEDGSGSTVFATSVGAGAAATFTGLPSFSSDGTSFAGCDALPQLNGARITAPVSSAATATNNVIRFALSVPAGGDGNAAGGNWNIAEIDTAGTFAKLEVYLLGNGTLQFDGVSSGGTILFTTVTTTNVQGTPLLVSAELTPSGGSVNWALRIIKPGGGAVLESKTGTRASSSIGAVSAVKVNRSGTLSDTVFGELGVFYAVPSLTTAAAALGGFAGEAAVDRFTRLCGEFSIAATVIGSASAAMGPQVDGQLAAILQSIEDTDGGMLFETPAGQFGLGYRTLGSMKDQGAVVTVAHSSGALGAPLTPTYDDQLIANSVTVTNYDGYSALAQCTSGAVSILAPPNGVGQGYAKSKTINANSDTQANTIAQQLLFQGTTDEVRYPEVTFNFLRTPAAPFFASVPGLRLGDYLQITSLPAFLGGGTAKQLIWGYTETIGGNPEGWTIAFNTIPENPFESAFSPGVFSVGQAVSGSVAAGSGVGSTVSGAQLAPGAALSGTISARTIGGITQFISAATPYDWVFAVSGTPADATYFIATEAQAFGIAVNDTFTNSGGLGGPFTVTSVDPPAGGNVTVHFTPDASSVMSSGTVTGGKNGDQWVNTSAGNQVNLWTNGAWVPVTWDASQVLVANTITASQIAAGIVIAGVVDGTVLQGVTVIADGTSGEILVYTGAPTSGNLIGSWSGAAGTDTPGNSFPAGLAVEQGGLVLFSQGSAPSAVSGASELYTSSAGGLRYLSSSGADLVLDRSALNLSTFSMTTQTAVTQMSGALNYLANEAVTGSEYEIEIDGTITTPTNGTSLVYNHSFLIDGVGSGINNVTYGAVILAGGLTVAYHTRWTLTVNTTGAGGTCNVIASGGMVIQFNGATQFNLGNLSPSQNGGGGGQGSTPINQITTGKAFDTTANHTLTIGGNWATGAGHTGHSAITYRTKITRRN